jgi:phosphomevalonate kinase
MKNLSITASSPGKVLISGGYLILDSNSPLGLVLSTSSRFFSTISTISSSLLPQSKDIDTCHSKGSIHVLVESLQFRTQWRYLLSTRSPFTLSPLSKSSKRNPYAEFAIQLGISATCGNEVDIDHIERFLDYLESGGYFLKIILCADNEFYSQRYHLESLGLPINLTSLSSLPKFLPCPLRSSGEGSEVIVNKTGLGSSAALVTSLVGAIAAFFTIRRTDEQSKTDTTSISSNSYINSIDFYTLIHNAAQIAHGLAQGKVGSGFDVSSATFGSILFSRIPSQVMSSFMEEALISVCNESAKNDSFLKFSKKLVLLSSQQTSKNPRLELEDDTKETGVSWNFIAKPFILPRGISIMLADVVGGSETPSMVRKVLSWRDTPENKSVETNHNIKEVDEEEDEDFQSDVLSYLSSASLSSNELEEIIQIENEVKIAANACFGPRLWKLLGAANARVASVFASLNRLEKDISKEDYTKGMQYCATHNWKEWGNGEGIASRVVCRTLQRLALAFSRSRKYLRMIGEQAGVPIEPPEQTHLANDTLDEKGVIAAGVPGAGGFDALFAVIISINKDDEEKIENEKNGSNERVRDRVEKRWLKFGNKGLTPLPLQEGLSGISININ